MDKLENKCVRIIAKNLRSYETTDYFEHLPPSMKRNILTHALRVYPESVSATLLRALLQNNFRSLLLNDVKLTDSILEIIVDKCPHLHEIDLGQVSSDCSKLGFDRFFKGLPQLRSIKVNNSQTLDDEIVRLITENCMNVKLLDLEGCSRVGDACAEYIAKTEIIRLNLSRTNITDETLVTFSLSNNWVNSLIEVNFNDCRITAYGLTHFRPERIKYIGLSRCTLDADEDFGPLWNRREGSRLANFISYTIGFRK